MVLTDLPFDRCKLLHNRYDMIRRPDSAPSNAKPPPSEEESAEQSKEYAAFLKSQERKVGPDGFLDSNRFSYTHSVKKEKDTTKPKSVRPRAKSDTTPENVVQLTAKIKRDEKDYDKRIKVIEDHMWQHKQEERELKRTEGDIIKNQRAVRHTLRDYGNAVNKKRIAEEKKLNQSLERFTKMSRDHVHTREENSKQRSQQSQAHGLAHKDQARKMELKVSDLERKYHAKKSAIELKRAEVNRLSQDFESKMRQKEEEQHKLKQELAELSITLNMEAQKARVQKHDYSRDKKRDTTSRIHDDLSAQKNLDHKLTKSDGDIKEAMMSKRKLDADLALTKAHLDIKKRDEQRHLTDTQIRLEDNTTTQRQLNDSAFHAGMDLKARQIDQKVEAHNARRVNRLTAHMKQKKEKEDGQQEVWEQRFRVRDHEAQRKKHEDELKFFQKMVNKGEEQEQMLYSNVRNAEYSRQKQDQAVRRLQQNLAEIKRINAVKMKMDAVERKRQEDDIQQQLIREKAELDKVHAQREESYLRLQAHRLKLKDDKHLLVEHDREHQRLLRIGARSDMQGDHY
ncbi:trichohyalin [Aplysia californica]|uniref:Trichohyalin n=1 Tax=Aplysia californica TaxID=6500 RepID=A0ABM0JD72_APLCA|nr:trichohyalin [Aplysia californica]